MARLRQRIPCIVSEHSVWLRDQYVASTMTASPFVRWISVRLMNAVADVVYAYADQLAPAWQFAAQWERTRAVEQGRIRVIHPGVAPRPLSKRGNASGNPVVVSVGDLHRGSGQLDVIEAAALVHQQLPAARFRLIGSTVDSRYAQQCRDLVHGLDLRNVVAFAAPGDAAADEIQKADVLAFPQVVGAAPLALLDAMMSAAAIVATDVGGMRDGLGDAGMVVPAGDPVTMAQSLATLLGSPASRRLLGEAARDRAVALFTDDHFVDAYRSAYASLIDWRVAGDETPALPAEPPLVIGAA
jgi:glycosyltransferase involved in cell wall biosynthesis